VRRGEATAAIFQTRLRREIRPLLLSCTACALLAYLQRNDDAAAHVAGSIVFAALTGLTLAVLTRASRRRGDLEMCELSAPLYGRELARARALVPCAIVAAAVGAYWAVSAAYLRVDAAAVAACISAGCATALIAMSAAGGSRGMFAAALGLASACAAGAFALERWNAFAAVALCAACAFSALRRYGEALAETSSGF
jgi:hypothetical protein